MKKHILRLALLVSVLALGGAQPAQAWTLGPWGPYGAKISNEGIGIRTTYSRQGTALIARHLASGSGYREVVNGLKDVCNMAPYGATQCSEEIDALLGMAPKAAREKNCLTVVVKPQVFPFRLKAHPGIASGSHCHNS